MDELSSKDHPDWWRPVGGANSKESTLERRSLIFNDSDPVVGTAPPLEKYGEIPGKFFTRGCRGMIEQIQVYSSRGLAVDDITLQYSPHPCLGQVREVTFTPGITWGWWGVAIEEMWDYDSLFIYIVEAEGEATYGYDTEQPFDGHVGTNLNANWNAVDMRLFIRVVYSGETPGDVPVSGIVNTIPIPSASSHAVVRNKGIVADDETVITWQYGAGYCDYIEALVAADFDSHLTYIRVFVDNVLAMEQQFAELSTNGHTASTPTVSLPKYGEDEICYMLIHKRFEFRRSLEVRAYNLPHIQIVSATIHPTLMR